MFSEPEALVPISMIDPNKGQIILAGDPLQLPPIVLSNHAKDRGLGNSMLERYIDRYGNMKTAEMVSKCTVCSMHRVFSIISSVLPLLIPLLGYNNYRKMGTTLIHDW